jgi:hypothetical protein
MDNNRRSFDEVTGSHFKEMLDDAARTGDSSRLDKIFQQGETVRVKNSSFIVRNIDHFTGIMTLKLLPGKKFE